MERKLRYFEDQIEKEKENLLIEKGQVNYYFYNIYMKKYYYQDPKDTYLISFGEEEKERIKMNFDELEVTIYINYYYSYLFIRIVLKKLKKKLMK